MKASLQKKFALLVSGCIIEGMESSTEAILSLRLSTSQIVLAPHRHGSRRWRGHIHHPGLYVVLEGSDVTFFFYDDAKRHSQRNIPRSLWHHDFSQISLLLHLEA